MICETTHTPVYDKQTGGSKCKKCGTLLDDFGNEYSAPLDSVKILDRSIEWAKLYKEMEKQRDHYKALYEAADPLVVNLNSHQYKAYQSLKTQTP